MCTTWSILHYFTIPLLKCLEDKRHSFERQPLWTGHRPWQQVLWMHFKLPDHSKGHFSNKSMIHWWYGCPYWWEAGGDYCIPKSNKIWRRASKLMWPYFKQYCFLSSISDRKATVSPVMYSLIPRSTNCSLTACTSVCNTQRKEEDQEH